MALSFYWHDYETFGLDPRRDGPSQFAGIRTNAELEEVGEPLMLYCRPPRDALPSPTACLITGTTPQHCEAHGVSEAEFSARILQELSTPETVGVGYNSLGFDDEVTRHLMWRTLREPYGREWQNQCSRWDLLSVVRCVYALRPQALQWPRTPEGRHSLKLEHLTAANGLAHDQAHDALSDVRATIALARRVREQVPKLWDYCLSLRHKARVLDLIGHWGQGRKPFLHVTAKVPQERGHLAVVWPLAPHPRNPNEMLVWDLAQDPLQLLELDAATLRERIFTRQDALPPGVERLPIKTIRVNQSPIVVLPLRTVSSERAEELGLDLAACEAHAQAALQQFQRFDAIDWSAVWEAPEAQAGLDAELTLYQGPFLSRNDRQLLEAVHQRSPEALAGWQPPFEDPRLPDLLLRYRARNWPDTLDADEQRLWRAHCRGRLELGGSGFRTLQTYSDEIDTLYEQADERQQVLLEALVDWAEVVAS